MTLPIPVPISLHGKPVHFSGWGYGLRYPSLVIGIEFEEGLSDAVQQLAARMAPHLPTSKPGLRENQAGMLRCVPVDDLVTLCFRLVDQLGYFASWAWRLHEGRQQSARKLYLRLAGPHPQLLLVVFSWLCSRLGSEGGATENFDRALQSEVERWRGVWGVSVNTPRILQAAHDLRMPVRFTDASTAWIGTGRYCFVMRSTVTERSSALGVVLSQNKYYTARVLRSHGLPGAVHRLVGSAEEATKAAEQLGFPVVVKPADLDRGLGVTAGVEDAREVSSAFEHARKLSRQVLVERHVDGYTHRFTVLEGRVIRVVRRIAGGVTGDGKHTITELVALDRSSSTRLARFARTGHEVLSLDAEAVSLLLRHGWTESSVPRAGQRVRLRRRDNINAGGTNQEVVLEQVHPANLQLAIDAAQAVRLDFAGVDIIMSDVTQSWLDQASLICEINAAPQLAARSDANIYREILRRLVGDPGWIPCHLVVSDAEGPQREGLVKSLVQEQGPCEGVSDRDGLWVGQARRARAFDSGFDAAEALLRHKGVEAATVVMSQRELLANGLPGGHYVSVSMPEVGANDSRQLAELSRLVHPHILKRD